MFHSFHVRVAVARVRRAGLLVITLLCPVLAPAQGSGALSADRTESPYFVVSGSTSGVDAMPLKATRVDARVLGVIADVRVTQHYRNEGDTSLEARYVFPASTRAAVYAMQVRIGERVLSASIREKQKAQVEYQQAKSAGKTAALLEQHRENVFQMHVANIQPGDDIEVELQYTELLVPTDGLYSFVFPTVVGPRYNGTADSASHKAEPWVATPYTGQGEPAHAGFEMNVRLLAPTALSDPTSSSHLLELQRIAANEVEVGLADTGRNENDRDFILDYRLTGERIESGLLLSKGDKENFFMAMLAPPQAVQSQMIVPREYIFVVDISGSMHGFPLDTAKRQVALVLRRLALLELVLEAAGNDAQRRRARAALRRRAARAALFVVVERLRQQRA
jgi:Ca-activated chloride channel family protein